MIYLALIPVAAVVVFCWFPRRPAPSSPFPPVTDTVAGHARRTRAERLTIGECATCGGSTRVYCADGLGDECCPHPCPHCLPRARFYDWTTDDGPGDAA